MQLKPLPAALLVAGLFTLSSSAALARADVLALGNLGINASGAVSSFVAGLNSGDQVTGVGASN